MGLDQNLYHYTPDIDNPFEDKAELAYWRKDWDLQDFIKAENCEYYVITAEFCDLILSKLDSIYSDNPHYKEATREAFTKAQCLIANNKKVLYHAWW